MDGAVLFYARTGEEAGRRDGEEGVYFYVQGVKIACINIFSV